MRKYLLSMVLALGTLLWVTEGMAALSPEVCKNLCGAKTPCQTKQFLDVCKNGCSDAIGKKCEDVSKLENKGATPLTTKRAVLASHCNAANCVDQPVKNACESLNEEIIKERGLSKTTSNMDRQDLKDKCLDPKNAKEKTAKEKADIAEGTAKGEAKAKATIEKKDPDYYKKLEAEIKKKCTQKACEDDIDVRSQCQSDTKKVIASIKDAKEKDKKEKSLLEKCTPWDFD